MEGDTSIFDGKKLNMYVSGWLDKKMSNEVQSR